MINKQILKCYDDQLDVVKASGFCNKALESSPENFNYLHTKRWGLYKQGKYQEALEILQKSWDIRREKAIYNHTAYLHLEEVKRLLPVNRIIELHRKTNDA